MTNRVFTGAVAALSALALTAGLGVGTANAAPYNKYPHQLSGMKAPNATYTESTFMSADGTKIDYKHNDVPNEKAQIVLAHGLMSTPAATTTSPTASTWPDSMSGAWITVDTASLPPRTTR